MIRLLLMICALSTLSASEILSWNDGLNAMHEGKAPAYAVYIGRSKSEMFTRLQRGEVNTGGIPIIHLSSNEDVTNPFTGRVITGRDMISNLTGPLNDLTGGSFLFFTKDGVLLPEFTIIQNFHRNRPAVIELYCQMIQSPLRGKMSLADFATYLGMPIGKVLMAEVAEGKHKDFAHLFRQVGKDEIFPRGVDGRGQVRDPKNDACITVITNTPNGEVFIAEMRELWVKLTVGVGADVQHPPLLVLGPADARYPALDALGIRYEVGYLTKEQLVAFCSPTIVLPGNQERQATIISGFIPGQVVGHYILSAGSQGLLTNFELLHPDIPVGDSDFTELSP